MPASTSPSAQAVSNCRRDAERTPGRVTASITMHAEPSRSRQAPLAPTWWKIVVAQAAPTWTELMLPSTRA